MDKAAQDLLIEPGPLDFSLLAWAPFALPLAYCSHPGCDDLPLDVQVLWHFGSQTGKEPYLSDLQYHVSLAFDPHYADN